MGIERLPVFVKISALLFGGRDARRVQEKDKTGGG